ncbi:hypothetical protein EDD15DRAFT_2370421 [Pisolithus albus]|nr:hypothetical protein EDD15DRAFT_2370421 [Pisolithus albus]
MASQQWLFRHSSPIRCGGITRVVIAEPHGHQVVTPPTSHPTTIPTILRTFTSRTEHTNGNHNDSQSPQGFAGTNPSESSTAPMDSSTNIPGQTTPADPPQLTISPRKRHKFRDSTGTYCWFESQGNSPIDHPPATIGDIQNDDIFFYWIKGIDKCQMWIWCNTEGRREWVPVQEGYQVKQEGFVQYLIVTDRRQPSLVLPGSAYFKGLRNDVATSS